MKKPKIQLDPERFYRTGKYLFFVVGIVGIIRLLDLWRTFTAYDVVGSIASTLFQFALFAFFAYLQGKEQVKELNDGDVFKMNEALEKLNLEENNVLEKTNGKKR
jgi:hypothetical protein